MTKVVNAFLGKSDKPTNVLENYRPTGISAGGFNFGGRDTISGGSTAQRLGFVGDVSNLFKAQAGEIRSLRPQVAPGFSQLRSVLGGVQQARLGQVETSRQRAIGDLRENLSRRRVLGSSFGQDALSRAEAEFSQEKDRITKEIGLEQAQTTLQELEMTKQLLTEEFNLSRASVQTFLDNMNIEAEIATKLAGGATSALSQNARAQADILQTQVNNTQEFLTEMAGVGAGYGLGGSAGALAVLSDRRFKKNIKRIGKYKSLNLYSFDYLNGQHAVGVMADEVEKIIPEAVTNINGVKYVKYGML